MTRFVYSSKQTFDLVQSIQSLTIQLTGISLCGEQAVTWVGLYPPDIIQEGIKVAASWSKRKNPVGPLETAFSSYASAVMRGKLEARDKYAALRAEGGSK